ncbi:MAG: acyl-CoA thioesterase II [Candidatus Binatia bacterium]
MTDPRGQAALDQLVSILDLEELELNLFRGRTPKEDRVRVFGGQVAGQALVAAGRTVEDGLVVHSLHSYFLRPGDPSIPIVYQVERLRDGKSFTTRRATAIQHGLPIFNLSASFQRPEQGIEHQLDKPESTDPDTLPTFRQRVEPYLEKVHPDLKKWLQRERPIDMRYVNPPDYLHPEKRPPHQQVWIRAAGTLPDQPLLLHQCIVAYASDMTLIDTATLPHAIPWFDPKVQMASLDHAMWFHRPFRADEWLLYSQESPTATGARGFTTGRLYTRDGVHVVSVAQEGLIRQRADVKRPR